jgi:predicted nuclease of predicted toxin-antitoxin system
VIIIDENIDQIILDKIRSLNYEVYFIRDHEAGISDQEVIEITKQYKGFLVTEDKDFGELVFAHNFKGFSVILLRYDKSDLLQVVKNIKKVLASYYENPGHYFFTITKSKIRVREI